MSATTVEPRAQPLLRDCFCLADGTSAALMHDATCVFWCAPGFDGPLRLARILDPRRGGSVGLRPTPEQGPPRGDWVGRSGLARWTWPGGAAVTCGLLPSAEGDAICWLAEGRAGSELEVCLQAPVGAGPWRIDERRARLAPLGPADGPRGPLELLSSEPLRQGSSGLRLTLPEGGATLWLALSAGMLPEPLARIQGGGSMTEASRHLLKRDEAGAEAWARELLDDRLGARLASAPGWAKRALLRSLITLRQLQSGRSGMLVASPLTSIPQGAGPERAWDYRYAWLRDCADAGMALLRAGAREEAVRLAEGLAAAVAGPEPAPMSRLDGGQPPPEHLLPYLSGYGGALVRVGNGAAGQTQLDTIGELVRLADSLDRANLCPTSLLERVPELADRAARLWEYPDHGIWEIRGQPRHYLHSKLLAHCALELAAQLAKRHRIRGDLGRWAAAEAGVDQLLRTSARRFQGALTIAPGDPGADSAALAGYLTGYLEEPSTLDLVTSELGEGPLLARYRRERDGIAEPCAPFIFPALWAVVAEQRMGRTEAAQSRLRSIVELAGPSGQLSEVADPGSRTLLGNYPQVQSHAALIEAVLEVWGNDPRGLG